MQTRQTVAPVYEPFTLEDIKSALRVTHTLQDDLIWSLARSARKLCEDVTRIAICPQTFKASLRAPMRRSDEFGLIYGLRDPERIVTRLVLSRPPTSVIDSVTLVSADTLDRLVLLSPDHYNFDPTWGAITWTDAGRDYLLSTYYPTLEVQFQAGNPVILNPGSNDLPEPDRTKRQVLCDDAIREAIYVTTAQGYDDPDAAKSNLPARAISLLQPYWGSNRLLGMG